MKNLTAVLLAAGMGTRISSLTGNPKCLLKVNGKSLLEHHLDNIITVGITKVVIVVGYKKEMILQAVEPYHQSITIEFVINDDYETNGNSYSFVLGLRRVENDALIFDADLIYSQDILTEFIADTSGSSVLVGNGTLDDIECAKTLVDFEGYVRMTIDKRGVTEEEIRDYTFVGEAIGIIRLISKDRRELLITSERFLADIHNISLNWEHMMNVFFQECLINFKLTNCEKWVEIDTAEDYNVAKMLFE